MRKQSVGLALLPLILSVACVGSSKSANPLSPVIAGPIPGVDISAPTTVAPGGDAQIDTNTQPITLQVANAGTNGVRPLSYRFEIATDLNFTNPVFTKESVAQAPSCRTSTKLPGPPSPERKCYWHARAQDGANTGSFGPTSAFTVFTPIVFGTPSLVSPINDDVATSAQPRLVIGNAPHSGPVEQVFYRIQLANSTSFNPLIGDYTISETGTQTEMTVPVSLAVGRYFWRAQAGSESQRSVLGRAAVPMLARGSGGGGGGGNRTATCESALSDHAAPELSSAGEVFRQKCRTRISSHFSRAVRRL